MVVSLGPLGAGDWDRTEGGRGWGWADLPPGPLPSPGTADVAGERQSVAPPERTVLCFPSELCPRLPPKLHLLPALFCRVPGNVLSDAVLVLST